MKIQPLVTVIIPNFKRDKELYQAVDSVISQTYRNLEIIIIDDFSPNFPKIEEMIYSIPDQRIKILRNNKNLGGGATRNFGIKKGKGKYMAFLDSDDTWMREKIAKQVAAAEKITGNVLVYNKLKVITIEKISFGPGRGIMEDELISDYKFVYNGAIQTSSIFLNSALVKKILFDETIPRHQDSDFLLRIASCFPKIIFINEVLTTVNWSAAINPVKKGWTPEVSLYVMNKNKQSFSKKSFENAYFIWLIWTPAIYYSKFTSLKFLFQRLRVLKFVSKKLILKYLLRLFFDWRYFVGSSKIRNLYTIIYSKFNKLHLFISF